MQRRGHVQHRRKSPTAEVSLLPTTDIMTVGGLDEPWLRDEGMKSTLRSWRMLHPAAHGICLLTLNTEDFHDPYPRLWDYPFPYSVANTYTSIAYSLLHGYDFLRVRLPSSQTMVRVAPWYKIPALVYLLAEGFGYVLYIDADAFVVSTWLTLPQAIPIFFDHPEKVAFAPKDNPKYGLMNCGTMVFRLQASGFEALMDEWWQAPNNDTSGICHYRDWPAEQGCWQQLYEASDSLIELGDEGWLKEQAGTVPKFIHHVTSLNYLEVRMETANQQAAQTLADLVHALLAGTL